MVRLSRSEFHEVDEECLRVWWIHLTIQDVLAETVQHYWCIDVGITFLNFCNNNNRQIGSGVMDSQPTRILHPHLRVLIAASLPNAT